MRILFASHHSSRIAGAETYVHTAATALSARGHDVALLAEHPRVNGREDIGGVQAAWCTSPSRPPEAIERAHRWAPDIVYVHGIASIRLERRLVDLAPAVLFEHSYAGLCISGSRTWLANDAPCPRTLGPGCIAHYFPRRCGGRSPVTMVQDYRMQRARRRLHPRYRAIVAASRHMAEALTRSGCDRVHVLPPPVMPPLPISPRAPGRAIRLVYAGRLERLKGAHLLGEAAREAAARLGRPIELGIAGDGPLRSLLQEQSEELSSFTVNMVLHGWQATGGRDALFASADVLLMPSLWPEPFGLVGLEAARFGVPTVAFASGGIPEWLRHDVNGLLVPERSARALGAAVADLLVDPRRYTRLSAAALAAARASAPDVHARRLEQLFSELAR